MAHDKIYPRLLEITQNVHDEMYNVHGFKMRITQGFRSSADQQKIYDQGRTAPGKIVTNSQPGTSWHEYGLAIDSCFTGPDPYFEKYTDAYRLWQFYGEIAEAHGLFWGGHFKKLFDFPHIQWVAPFGIARAKELFESGGLDAVWKEIF